MTASIAFVQPIDPTHDGEPNETDGLRALPEHRGRGVQQSLFAQQQRAPADQFKAFSPKKLFMAVGSNQVEVDFKLAGTTTNGVVKGFGVVFSDVDKAAATRVEYFDANGVELASIAAPAHLGAQGFTFVGAVFNSAIVARVLITSGEAALDATSTDVSADGTQDLVVMDDFVYGEPQPLPQTSNYSRSL